MCFSVPGNPFPRYLHGLLLPNLTQASEKTFQTTLFNIAPQSLSFLFPCFFSLIALSLPTLSYIFNCRLFSSSEWKLQERRNSESRSHSGYSKHIDRMNKWINTIFFLCTQLSHYIPILGPKRMNIII